MKPGDLVKISSNFDGDIDGKLATVMGGVDENLNPGRCGEMPFIKVFLMISETPVFRYISLDSLELVK